MKSFKGYEKGVNLGGWLSQCGADNYNDEHYSSFILEKDIEKIASWGLDHVRLPVDYNVIQNEDGSIKEEGFAYIDACLSWCEKYGLKMVFDLHKAQGYVFDDSNYCGFFTDESYQQHFYFLWKTIVERYKDKCDTVAFELLNEITARETAEIWNRIAKRTVQEIRTVSKDARIIIGGIFNSSIYGLTLLDAPYDENIVFTFHCYNPLLFTHQGAGWVSTMPADFRISYDGELTGYREKSREIFGNDFDSEYNGSTGVEYFNAMFSTVKEIEEKYDVPMYCGEYGVIDLADTESTVLWYKNIHTALVQHGYGRAAWSYKEMNFGLIGEHYKDILPQLIELM